MSSSAGGRTGPLWPNKNVRPPRWPSSMAPPQWPSAGQARVEEANRGVARGHADPALGDGGGPVDLPDDLAVDQEARGQQTHVDPHGELLTGLVHL